MVKAKDVTKEDQDPFTRAIPLGSQFQGMICPRCGGRGRAVVSVAIVPSSGVCATCDGLGAVKVDISKLKLLEPAAPKPIERPGTLDPPAKVEAPLVAPIAVAPPPPTAELVSVDDEGA